MAADERICLSTNGLKKTFGGTVALHDASIDFIEGEIHALCGENGAGKSTLCKMLSGAIAPDEGTIAVNGQRFARFTPKEAMHNGISMIYQEFNLVNDLPIYENLFIGKELRHGPLVDRNEMIKRANNVFDMMDIEIDPRKTIAEISVAYCQLVEIAKSLLEEKKILIMDEPTAPLTNQEVDNLFRLVRNLKERGLTIIYISHRMEEILELSDRVTVMCDGAISRTLKTKETDANEIIRLMIGKEASTGFPANDGVGTDAEVLLSVSNLKNKKLKGVSFELRRGEILGLAGLVGAGRTETARAIFGADTIESGTIEIYGKKTRIKSPADAVKKGIALIPEDRKRQGIHLELPIFINTSLVVIDKLSKLLTIIKQKERELINAKVNSLSIKLGSADDSANSLSGGNQQKIVLAKWLSTDSEIFVFDEPTRGIDVGAKSEIYYLMDQMRRDGKAILMISSEMHEIIGMCDRVIVLYEGEMMGELGKESMTQKNILEYASGIRESLENKETEKCNQN
jgi:ribose transport system ATP-binding protein